MINNELVRLAFRARASTLVVCTTGSMSLSATATGYSRATGSFLTDGFAAGHEVTPAGFATNTVDTITQVTATDVTVLNPRAVEVAAGSRSLSVGLPALRTKENTRPSNPIIGTSWVEENYVPGTAFLLAGPAQGGMIQESGLFIWKWYVPQNTGFLGLTRGVEKLKALFTPGTNLNLSDGTNVAIRTDTTTKSSQILPDGYGWAVCTVTAPWWSLTINTIAP